MTSEAVLIERSSRMLTLSNVIEELDAYLAERQEFHANRKNSYAGNDMPRAHEQEQKEARIRDLRDDIESAFEKVEEDFGKMENELRVTQDALRSIE